MLSLVTAVHCHLVVSELVSTSSQIWLCYLFCSFHALVGVNIYLLENRSQVTQINHLVLSSHWSLRAWEVDQHISVL
jgi:hypothetical protein